MRMILTLFYDVALFCTLSCGVLMSSAFILPSEKFFLKPTEKCTGNPPPEILIWIHSAPKHIRQRNAIRMTWGLKSQFDHMRVELVFFLGLLPDQGSNASSGKQHDVFGEGFSRLLEYEQQRYNDIVQGDFLDTYQNMTYKALFALKWIESYCDQAKFIMKTDDDIIVNIRKLYPFLYLKMKRAYYPLSVISCNLWSNQKPVRDPSDKWYISYESYGNETYPPFCQGMVYFITPDLVSRLLQQAATVPYVFMDDVYLTGLVPSQLTKPSVRYKKLSAEYAKVYGIGDKVINFVRNMGERVTFIHTEGVDVFLISWSIISNLWSYDMLLSNRHHE